MGKEEAAGFSETSVASTGPHSVLSQETILFKQHVQNLDISR